MSHWSSDWLLNYIIMHGHGANRFAWINLFSPLFWEKWVCPWFTRCLNAHMMQNSAIASINPLCQCREMTDFGDNCKLRTTSSAAAQFLDLLIIRACWKCTASWPSFWQLTHFDTTQTGDMLTCLSPLLYLVRSAQLVSVSEWVSEPLLISASSERAVDLL